jgi:hypothetical protein
MPRQTLVEWLEETIELAKPKGDKPGGCVGLELFHKLPGADVSVRQMPLGGSHVQDCVQIANMFSGIMKNHAAGLVGVQNYEMCAYKDGENEPYSRRPDIANGRTDLDGLGTEAPSIAGHAQQMMRHNEALFRATMVHNEELFDKVLTVMYLQVKQNASLMKENHDALELAKIMILDKSDNEYAKQVELTKLQQSVAERKQFISLLPPLVNQLTGHEVFPQQASDTAIIDAIADSITPEQIEKFASLDFPPAIVGMIMTRLEKRVKETNKAGGNGNGNPIQ